MPPQLRLKPVYRVLHTGYRLAAEVNRQHSECVCSLYIHTHSECCRFTSAARRYPVVLQGHALRAPHTLLAWLLQCGIMQICFPFYTDLFLGWIFCTQICRDILFHTLCHVCISCILTVSCQTTTHAPPPPSPQTLYKQHCTRLRRRWTFSREGQLFK